MKPKHHQQGFLPTVFLVAGVISVIVGNQHFTGEAAAIASVLLIGLGAFAAILGASWLILNFIRARLVRRHGIDVRKTLASLAAGAGVMLVVHLIRRF